MPEHLHRYVLRAEIAGLTNEHKIKTLKERGDRDDVDWAPSPPAVDGIAKLDIHVSKVIRGRERANLGTVVIQRKANFITGNGEYLAITLELFHDRPTKQLELRVTQRLDEPIFTKIRGLEWPSKSIPGAYHYNKLVTFKTKFTSWITVVDTALKQLPNDISRAQAQINRWANDSMSIDRSVRSAAIKKIATAQADLVNARASIPKCRIALKDLADVKTWHGKVTTDMEQLLEKFQIDFELIRDPDSSDSEIVVTSKGSE